MVLFRQQQGMTLPLSICPLLHLLCFTQFTSDKKVQHADVAQYGTFLMTLHVSTHSFLLPLWRRERGDWIKNQPLLCHRLQIGPRERLSDLHPHLQLATCGFTSIHHLQNTNTLLRRSACLSHVRVHVINTHLYDLPHVTVVFQSL